MNIISFSNKKGGVSKTTSAVNVASIMAEEGYKVLLIDLDEQGNATAHLGATEEDIEINLYHVLTGKNSLKEAIVETAFGVDLIGADNQLRDVEIEMHRNPYRDMVLDREFRQEDLDYDFVILDLPPEMGVVSFNGLIASDNVIVPVDVGKFSTSTVNEMESTIRNLNMGNPDNNIKLMGVLITRLDYTNNLSRDIPLMLRETLVPRVFDTQIRHNVHIVEAQNESKPINHYRKDSNGYKEYHKFVKEVIEIDKQEE